MKLFHGSNNKIENVSGKMYFTKNINEAIEYAEKKNQAENEMGFNSNDVFVYATEIDENSCIELDFDSFDCIALEKDNENYKNTESGYFCITNPKIELL